MWNWCAVMASGLSLLSGCLPNVDETTVVRIRHASAVAVGARTPGGATTLLEAEGPPRQVNIPATMPPFTEEVKGAFVVRQDSGAVTLICPSCKGAPGAAVVPSDTPIELHGSPQKSLVWTPGALEMRFGHDALFACHRGRGDCRREALALWLATPAANVVDIRSRKFVVTENGERIGARISTVFGSIFLVGGIALGIGFSLELGRADAGVLLASGGFVAGGIFFTATGIRGLLAKDSETVTLPRPAMRSVAWLQGRSSRLRRPGRGGAAAKTSPRWSTIGLTPSRGPGEGTSWRA